MENLPDTPIVNVPYYDENRFVSPWNHMDGVHPDTLRKNVYIHDVTLRDGGQTPGVVWRLDERIKIALALNEMGVEEIEIGMPIDPDVQSAMKELVKYDLQARIVPFARAMQEDIDAALDAGAKSIVVEHCLNPYLNKHVYGLDKEKLISRLIRWVGYAKQHGLRTTFMGWDVTRASFDLVWEIYSTVIDEVKPDALVITDSFGVASPFAIYMAINKFKKSYPDMPLELHTHNEFGLAMGSVFSAVAAGVDGIHTSVNGLGERTGNVSTEEVAAGLEIVLGIKTGIKLDRLMNVSRLVKEISKEPIAPNKPIVGERVFTVESGVVTQIIRTMEELGCKTGMTPYSPELVGRSPTKLVLGQGTGKNTISFFLKQAGISATKEEEEEILQLVRAEAKIRKSALTEDDLREIARIVL